ncbi:hypothetical protein [Lentibacter algarum]|uniref:hypothetical protein n=1 Tax=Lentibacter algarum TaxID=576131 RepID=UPI003AF59451
MERITVVRFHVNGFDFFMDLIEVSGMRINAIQYIACVFNSRCCYAYQSAQSARQTDTLWLLHQSTKNQYQKYFQSPDTALDKLALDRICLQVI